MKSVLLPLDGTKNAEAALAMVEDICDKDTELILLSVKEPEPRVRTGFTPGVIITQSGFPGAGPDLPTYAETKDQALQEEVDQAKDYIEGLAGPLRERGYHVRTEVLINKKPDAAIIEYARETHPTFIAMLRRTHPTLGEILFGSIASSVVRANVAPVLFVPEASASSS